MAASSRKERKEALREAIVDAAARVVGRRGYAKASIARIAEEAGVAYGSIYQYFRNQRDVFERLLPLVGERMLRFIRDRSGRAETVMARETLGLDANFEYLSRHPELHRIMNEAPFFVPDVFRAHLERMSAGYQRSLRAGLAKGELPGFREDEIEALTYILMGAREYLLEKYCVTGDQVRPLPPHVRDTYLKFVGRGLTATTPEEAPRREAG